MSGGVWGERGGVRGRVDARWNARRASIRPVIVLVCPSRGCGIGRSGVEDYEREDGLGALGVRLCPLRRRSRRRVSEGEERVRARCRWVVETVSGVVKECIGIGGRVRAVSLAGVELKVLCGVLAYDSRWLFRQLQSA